ncbi:DegT/DnrJ/EryC1/StrS family aminotransferase [Halosimplex sp. J119]
MLGESPSLASSLIVPGDQTGTDQFLRSRADEYRYYGSGKAALRDGLAPFVEPGENALLPAYLPDAVPEVFADLGLEVRFYPVTRSLAPDPAEVAARADEDTVAVVAVDYFGFPNPALPALRDLADDRNCLLVGDSSHGAFSVADGALLGTRGDLGFASLHKLLPIPDGACLFLDEDRAGTVGRSDAAGRREQFQADDWQFLATDLAKRAIGEPERLREFASRFLSEGETAVADPAARYEASKSPMSKLSAAVLARIDPAAVRGARRANYAAWDRGLADQSDVRPLFDDLPPGVCPQVYPVVADAPRRFRDDLERCGVTGAYAWPRLSQAVRDHPEYGTATRLAEQVIALPVHQHLARGAIEEACRRFRH